MNPLNAYIIRKCLSQRWLIFITSQLHDFLVASSANCKWRILFRVSLLTQRAHERRAAANAAAFPRCPTHFFARDGSGKRATQAHDEERTKLCAYAPSRSLTEMSTYLVFDNCDRVLENAWLSAWIFKHNFTYKCRKSWFQR